MALIPREGTPEYFIQIDNEVCNLTNIYDRIILDIPDISCSLCSRGKGQCFCTSEFMLYYGKFNGQKERFNG